MTRHPPLPSVHECLALLQEQGAPIGLLRHCQAVAQAAFCMATWLQAQGEAVDPLLAHRGGLLHDLDKISAQRQGRTHGHLGAEILRQQGYLALAEIAQRHLISSLLQDDDRPRTWEEKLVYYADKVVEGDQVVPVPQRMAALALRYPTLQATLQRCEPMVLALEAEICAQLGLSAAELHRRLQRGCSPSA
ncbi:MAG: HDIG domain-containing protein [Chloroflexi bacterium]|nr:HDIG domain-containing protein [Chloroflexota bacterium]